MRYWNLPAKIEGKRESKKRERERETAKKLSKRLDETTFDPLSFRPVNFESVLVIFTTRRDGSIRWPAKDRRGVEKWDKWATRMADRFESRIPLGSYVCKETAATIDHLLQLRSLRIGHPPSPPPPLPRFRLSRRRKSKRVTVTRAKIFEKFLRGTKRRGRGKIRLLISAIDYSRAS